MLKKIIANTFSPKLFAYTELIDFINFKIIKENQFVISAKKNKKTALNKKLFNKTGQMRITFHGAKDNTALVIDYPELLYITLSGKEPRIRFKLPNNIGNIHTIAVSTVNKNNDFDYFNSTCLIIQL